jgi:hypothetical protein
MVVDVNMIHGPVGTSLRENKEWILILFKKILDRIIRIIFFIFGFQMKPKIYNPLSAEIKPTKCGYLELI